MGLSMLFTHLVPTHNRPRVDRSKRSYLGRRGNYLVIEKIFRNTDFNFVCIK